MIKLVACDRQYWEFVRELRMDKRVSHAFIKSCQITPELQEHYMLQHSQYYRICLLNDQPAGYVGVVENDIRVCTHPDFQGRGVGLFMVREISKLFPHAIAKVKVNNIASLKLFEKAGFEVRYLLLEKRRHTESAEDM
jgi:ribosomal protein S18 acetylase RimI-like enzyme